MTQAQKDRVKALLLELKPSRVNHGDCIGADAEFHALVKELLPECEVYVYPCIIHKKRAYCKGHFVFPADIPLARNKTIVNCSNELAACPNESEEKVRSGTWATIRHARKEGTKVHLFLP